MSGVPKSRRMKHSFDTPHKFRKLRATITELTINDFGYDKQRLELKIQKFESSLVDFERKADVVASMRRKNEEYYTDFVQEETVITRDMIRKAVCEFHLGNSIFPSGDAKAAEFRERRKHLDESIGWLHCLKQELQYIAETLPGDKNRYTTVTEEIETLISMVKGVRRSANRFLKRNQGNL